MTRVPVGRSTSTSWSPEKRVRGALRLSIVTTEGWLMASRDGSGDGSGREANDRPVIDLGELGELPIGVDRGGVADDGEHRHVGVAVRVGEALVEIVAPGARVLAD